MIALTQTRFSCTSEGKIHVLCTAQRLELKLVFPQFKQILGILRNLYFALRHVDISIEKTIHSIATIEGYYD